MGVEVVDEQFVKDHIGKLPIIDVRPADMYAQGHIPTAKNVPFDQLKGETVGKDGPDESAAMAEDFARHLAAAGIGVHDEAIVSCQIGYHALKSCDMLATQGYDDLKLYGGSYQEWAADPKDPIER